MALVLSLPGPMAHRRKEEDELLLVMTNVLSEFWIFPQEEVMRTGGRQEELITQDDKEAIHSCPLRTKNLENLHSE
jgi:hypothetical protein